jgi:YfiH family protein
MVYSGESNSPTRENCYRSLGLDPARVYGCTQVHSRKVLAVNRRSPNLRPEADGLVCRDRALVLSVTVADCLPVYLYDARGGGFALVHSGWQGTGIALEALRLMTARWGTRPEEVAAVLGPCIRGCCYRVDAERACAFEAEFGGGAVRRVREPPGEGAAGGGEGRFAYYLDLPAANIRLLADAGVRNIAVCGDCTFTDDNFGSFRREGINYTRMAALIGVF